LTSNYFTLASIVRELKARLEGVRFLNAYSVRANELRLRFETGTLVALLRPISGALFFSSREEHLPKQNIHYFFEDLAGQQLSDISIAERDRIIILAFAEGDIELSFFGTPNARLLKETKSIESFKKSGQAETPRGRGGSPEELLGKRYLREAKERGTDPLELVKKIEQSEKAYIYSKEDDILLSLISLKSLHDGWKVESFDTVDEAVRKVVIARAILTRQAALRKKLLDSVDSEIERLSRSQSEMRKGVENSNRAERYAAIGNALLQVGYTLEQGVDSATLEIEEEPLDVKLDPTLTPYENASRYFERSKAAKASKESLRERSAKLREELSKLEKLRGRIIDAQDTRELEKIERESASGVTKPQASSTSTSKFREFAVAGGMRVLVGKNAKQNDELTTRVAKKDDVWLHARGVPGSHVVLQAGGRKQIPKEAIEQAAEIAAYFSDARTQGLAPVSYALRKYVRKPKGADPGSVIMEREEVVMVVPREPNLKE